jgi:acetoin utilization protein AcuB
MSNAIRVGQFMSPNPISIDSAQPLMEAHRLMRQKRLRHLPVLTEGRVVGVVSAGDLHLLETLDGVDPERVAVQDAMTPDPYRVPPDAALDEVVDVMAGNKYGCALVVENERLIGIFTTVDALEVLGRVLRGKVVLPPIG